MREVKQSVGNQSNSTEGAIVNKNLHGVSVALLLLFGSAVASLADDGSYKGRLAATGANCRGSSYFDIEATVAGDKLEGTMNSSTFRNPAKFTGAAAGTTISATLVFQTLNNLRSDIAGTRTDADNYAVTIKFNGGGPNNCEASGSIKKG
jgi:hypothetical protein